MKAIEIIGYKRANLGKKTAKKLRAEAYVPGVLYGGKMHLHFYAPMAHFKALVYTAQAHFVNLHLEGKVYRCILQAIQFHPVSEMMLHVDFLQIFNAQKIKMAIPTVFEGKSIGIGKGGILAKKQRKLPVIAYPKDMPDHIRVDITPLDLGQISRVQDIKTDNYTILALPNTPVAAIEIPRALRSTTNKEEGTPTKGSKK